VKHGVVLFLVLLLVSTSSSASQQLELKNFDQLAAQERWQEIVVLAETIPDRPPSVEYHYGVALAHLERWDEARKVLLAGSRMSSGDKRFPIELAGVDFKQKRYVQARQHLRRALQLDPGDSYANDFMATLYFLQGNLEAAVKYWNRVDKPKLNQVRADPVPHLEAVLLDHAFAFSPASTLTLRELFTSEGRIEGLEIFPVYHFDLQALPEGKFDLLFRAQERNGLGHSTLERLLTVFRGLPFQEVDPEYFNLNRHAINIVSLFRWDSEKRRLLASLSGPMRRNPMWRYRLFATLFSENWDVRESFSGVAPVQAALNLRHEDVSAAITRFFGQHHSWSLGMQISHRDYRNIVPDGTLDSHLLSPGYELKQIARLNYELWRVPERRFTVDSCVESQVARIWSGPPESFTKLQGCLESRWLPRPQGDDYSMRWRVQAGKTFGQLPFDELFMLGMERDNDLWLRAHIGTRGGRKGSAPLGRNYFLSNWETDKNLYRNGIFTLKLSPFLDTGKITDTSSTLGSRKWLWDTGIQAKLQVFGVGLAVIYGKDLRTGRNAFNTTVALSSHSSVSP